jgi:hypothetical protein
MNKQQRKLRKDLGNDTHVRSIEVDRFSKKSTQAFEILSGEILATQPEPIFRQNAVTVQFTRGGKITGVAYPGAFIDPITNNLHGTYEGPIKGQMVNVGFLNGNRDAPFVVNKYPYQGVGNTLTEIKYIQPMTKKLYDATDVLIGHFSGSIIRFNTGIISGKLPGSISVESVTDVEITAKTNLNLKSTADTKIEALNVKLNASTSIQIKSATQSMKTLIDSLIDVLNGLVTVGSSTTQTISPATIALLNAEKAKWAGLLQA